jgi:RNA polymerase sigma factor (sigma-70 family)
MIGKDHENAGDEAIAYGESVSQRMMDMTTRHFTKVIQALRRSTLQDEAALGDGQLGDGQLGDGQLGDGQLLDRFIQQQDEAAFAALVHRHGPMVWGVCRRIVGHHHDAEDAFQAAFLVLARKAASIRPPEMVANWLHGVAHRTALKAKATASKRLLKEKQVTNMPEPKSAPHDPWRDLEALIDLELSRLPDKYRIAILLCDVQGKTGKEAARQLKVPEGTLASRLRTGRVMLARRLARHGIGLSAGALAVVLAQNAASATAPAAVVASTIKTATLISSGTAAAAGMVPAKVAALMEGVLKTMLLTKIRIAVSVIALAGLSVFGGRLLAQKGAADEPVSAGPAQYAEPSRARKMLPQAGRHAKVVYPVADLVVPIDGLDGNEKTTKEYWLIQKIIRAVAPQTWKEQGGTGSIQYYPLKMTLVVTNTPAVQAGVNDPLETMRRVQNIEVSVELRVVTVRESFFRKLQDLFADLKVGGRRILNEAEVSELVEKVQTDRGTSVMQAPKMTLFSGQRASIRADALDIKLMALVAVNLRHVELDIDAKVGEAKWTKSCCLTDGATLVLTAGSGGDSIKMLLATPHVVINVEQPEAQGDTKIVPAGAAAAPLPATDRTRLKEALRAYQQACDANDLAKARQWAFQAIEMDPACFHEARRSAHGKSKP